MNAKERAKQLYAAYKKALNINNDMRATANPFAKQCALICVDEMILFNGELWLTGKINQKDYQQENGYLFEIKQEIEKL